MNWLTTIWAMIASASLAIAAVYLFAWFRSRESIAYLMFALLTISVSMAAGAEIWMMHAESARQFGSALRWFHVPIFLAVVSCVGLVHERLGSDRLWLGQAAVGLRALSLIPNFFSGQNLNYIEITELKQIEVLGEHISVVSGVPNPFMLVGQLSLALLFVYILDAAIATWRQRRKPQRIALSAVLLALVFAGTTQAVVGFWGIVEIPVVVSPFFIGVAIVMGIELGAEMLRAPRLDRALQQSREQLEHMSRAAALSELSGALAHEINQPLGVILSNAEAAELMLDSNEPDLAELKDIVVDIIDADRRAANVITRLRSLLERGDPNLQDLAINDAVIEALGHLRSGLGTHGVDVVLDLDNTLPVVSADRILIVQLVLNLLNNACDAVAGTTRGRRRVNIGSTSDKQTVTMTVSDNGHGLPDNKEEIFDPFVTTKASGLGMGLAIARSIVEAHEGRIWAESENGSGTSFHVSLPRKLAEP